MTVNETDRTCPGLLLWIFLMAGFDYNWLDFLIPYKVTQMAGFSGAAGSVHGRHTPPPCPLAAD